jgi:hypothetical protein
MKALFLYILFTLTMFTLQAQKAMTFEQAKASGISTQTLDSLYQSALHSDSTKSVFGKRPEEFMKGYSQLLKDLNQYLHGHGYRWEQETRCFNRIYFNPDGSIAYFLYNLKKGVITPEKEKQFDTLLNGFIKTYRFPLGAPVRFAQCSPTVYRD